MDAINYAEGIDLERDRAWTPTEWQKRGLQQTATGYGSKINSGYTVPYNGRMYRVYAICYSNAATFYIIVKGQRLFIH
jgi:hypothetical protein